MNFLKKGFAYGCRQSQDKILEQSLIKAWTTTRCTSLVALKRMQTLEINMEALCIQYILTVNTNIVVHKLMKWRGEDESPTHKRAPIKDCDEKITWLRRVCKVWRQKFNLRKNKSNESMWDRDGTFNDESSLFVNGTKFTTSHFIRIWKP